MRKPIEIRIECINRTRTKGTIALYKIISVYGLMDTYEWQYRCSLVEARKHIKGFHGNAKPAIPVIVD